MSRKDHYKRIETSAVQYLNNENSSSVESVLKVPLAGEHRQIAIQTTI